MYTIFVVATQKKRKKEKNHTWTMYTIFIVATQKKEKKKKNNTWTMYTIFIVVIQNKKKRKKQHLDNVHNIHCCNPKEKKTNNIGQCTIRYIEGECGETEHAGGQHACLGEKAKSLR
jgi:hypothetical protein